MDKIKCLMISLYKNKETLMTSFNEHINNLDKEMDELRVFLQNNKNYKKLFSLINEKSHLPNFITIKDVTDRFSGRIIHINLLQDGKKFVANCQINFQQLCKEKSLDIKKDETLDDMVKYDIDFENVDFLEDTKILEDIRKSIKGIMSIKKREFSKLVNIEKIREYDVLLKKGNYLVNTKNLIESSEDLKKLQNTL